MLKLLGKIPSDCIIALSGGVDSMALLSFVRNNPKNKPSAAFFHHGTETSEAAMLFLKDYCGEHNIDLTIGSIQREKTARESPEEYWRNERKRFFYSLENKPILQAHHLDDQVETWLFNSLHGRGRLIPYQNGNIFRPFLLCEKKQLKMWCVVRNVPWIEDHSNNDLKYTRNRIRHVLLPEALKVHPGLKTTVRNLVLAENKYNG